ncbi:MAG: TIGR02569 family protein, partial [Gordonia sp. (in: high G+C Gram-positive bacteria)]|nr:TIGR02569 family protein [Gordonia sp. (in: high G+C Gram-positive bacteria)]
MTTIVEPPAQVLTTFGLTAHPPIAMEGVGWRVGEVVLTLVPDRARAAWSATARENLYVEGMPIARPMRASDGRYVG